MRLDKEFYTHLAHYQAVVNPDKIDEAFKSFRKAIYPHLEKIEEKRKEITRKKLLKEVEKGEMVVKPLLTTKQDILKFNRSNALKNYLGKRND